VAGGAGEVVLDMAEVSFLDSAGLGVILGCFRRLPAGVTMTLRAPRPHVRTLLDLSGVGRLMRIENGPAGGKGSARRG